MKLLIGDHYTHLDLGHPITLIRQYMRCKMPVRSDAHVKECEEKV